MSRAIVCDQTIDRDAAELTPGIPAGVEFGNLPQCLVDFLGRRGSFYVPGDQILPLARQVEFVKCCGRPSFRSRELRSGQLAYWLTQECSKRHSYTNRILRTRNGNTRGAVGFDVMDTTPEQSQASYAREMDAGMTSLWTMTISPAGMRTITVAPLEYSRLLLEAHILLGECASLHKNPGRHNVGLVSASVPWGRYEFADGKHVYGNAIADNGLSIGTDFGDGYAGRQKKQQMGAHMVFLKQMGQFVAHIGVGELDYSALTGGAADQEGVLLMMGSSGVGKSQVVEPEPSALQFVSALDVIRQRYPNADFTKIRTDDSIIIEGRRGQKVRALIVDDIAAVFIDPTDGSVWIYCLEGGYYLRLDQWDKKGVITVVDRMAFSDSVCATDAIWSNVDVGDDGVPIMGEFHDLEGNTTQNPRISVRKKAFRAEERADSGPQARKRATHLAFGTASSIEEPMFMPAFSMVSLPQMLALAGPALRTAGGTQSFSASGSGTGWVTDDGFTQAQFTARGPGAVTQDVLGHFSQASSALPCFFISQRASTVFRQEMLYDALWTLRKAIESGVDLTQCLGKKLPGRYWGWVVRHPDFDPRLTDPFETVPADVLETCAREFDDAVQTYWTRIMDDPALDAETRCYVRNLIFAEMPSRPDKQFELTV